MQFIDICTCTNPSAPWSYFTPQNVMHPSMGALWSFYIYFYYSCSSASIRRINNSKKDMICQRKLEKCKFNIVWALKLTNATILFTATSKHWHTLWRTNIIQWFMYEAIMKYMYMYILSLESCIMLIMESTKRAETGWNRLNDAHTCISHRCLCPIFHPHFDGIISNCRKYT